jgi:hypothetical protein
VVLSFYTPDVKQTIFQKLIRQTFYRLGCLPLWLGAKPLLYNLSSNNYGKKQMGQQRRRPESQTLPRVLPRRIEDV